MGLSVGNGELWPLQKRHPLTNSPNLVTLEVYKTSSYAKFDANLLTEAFSTGWNIKKCIYTHFSWTHQQVRLVDGFSRLMAQTTRTRARCVFWGSINTAPYLWGQIHKTPIWGHAGCSWPGGSWGL